MPVSSGKYKEIDRCWNGCWLSRNSVENCSRTPVGHTFGFFGKRVRFLNDVIADNQLTDIQALHGRAEDVAREKAHREAYDIGIARAVASLTVLCEYVLPLVRIGGLFVAMKGSDIHNEIKDGKAISILGGAIKASTTSHYPLIRWSDI